MRFFICLTLVFSAPLFTWAQGTINGRAIDRNGEFLYGVLVHCAENEAIHVQTDFDGNFQLVIPDSKKYTLHFRLVGYQELSEPIQLKGNETITRTFTLTSSSYVGPSINVVGKRIKSDDTYMEKMKMNSATTIDFISAETMKKTGDATVVSAVARVSGVSTNGGLITVRGIGDRYVKTTLNGSRIPTLDPLTNNIKLDIFPSSLVDNIIVTKTQSPELPGDWSGAYLSVETKDYPEKLNVNIESQFGYNVQTSFKDIISSDRSSTDWLGFDNGLRNRTESAISTPNLNPSTYDQMVALGLGGYFSTLGIQGWNDGSPQSQTYFKLGLVKLGLLSSSQFNDPVAFANATNVYNQNFKPQAFSRINPNGTDYNNGFSNNWNTKFIKGPLNFSQSFSIGDQKKLFGNQLGYIFGFKYGTNYRYDPNGISQRVGDESLGYPFARQDNAQISREINSWSALLNLAYKFDNNHKISLLFMPNFIGTNDVASYESMRLPTDYQEVDVSKNIFYEQRKQLIYQASSMNYFPKYKLRANLHASYTDAKSVAPDFKATQYMYVLQNDSVLSYQFSPTAGDGIRRYYRYLTETLSDVRGDFEIPISTTDKATKDLKRKVKFGFASQRNYRKIDNDEYRVQNGNNLFTPALTNTDLNTYLDPSKFVMTDGTLTYFYQHFDYARNHSFGQSNITAGYAMSDFECSPKLRLSGGLRAEHTYILTDVDSYHLLGYERNDPRRENVGGFPFVNQALVNKWSLLPSLSVVYKIQNDSLAKTNLRLNYSQSVARPSIRELNDAAIYDNEFRTLIYGNSDLKMAHITNYDARVEKYFESGDNMSLSLFYKNFTNHIEMGFGSVGITWENIQHSNVRGIELEGKKQFGHLELRSNVTLVKSQAQFVRRDFQVIDGIKVYSIVDTLSRPMYGQAPYLVNAIASYAADSLGIVGTLSYNVQGPRLVIAGAIKGRPDVYELPRNTVDFKISKSLGKKFSVSLTIRDILNAPVRRAYKLPSGWVDYDRFRYGTNYLITFGYKL